MTPWMRTRILLTIVLVLGVALSTRTDPAQGSKPTEEWTLHIDAKKHFPGRPDMIAHHYCKPVSGGLTQCQLYESDSPDARLVGVEVVVSPEIYKTFSGAEKKLWHYHKTEIPKVSATLPEHSPEEATKVLQGMEETYGKVYLLWDPSRGNLPTGRPLVSILK